MPVYKTAKFMPPSLRGSGANAAIQKRKYLLYNAELLHFVLRHIIEKISRRTEATGKIRSATLSMTPVAYYARNDNKVRKPSLTLGRNDEARNTNYR